MHLLISYFQIDLHKDGKDICKYLSEKDNKNHKNSNGLAKTYTLGSLRVLRGNMARW